MQAEKKEPQFSHYSGYVAIIEKAINTVHKGTLVSLQEIDGGERKGIIVDPENNRVGILYTPGWCSTGYIRTHTVLYGDGEVGEIVPLGTCPESGDRRDVKLAGFFYRSLNNSKAGANSTRADFSPKTWMPEEALTRESNLSLVTLDSPVSKTGIDAEDWSEIDTKLAQIDSSIVGDCFRNSMDTANSVLGI